MQSMFRDLDGDLSYHYLNQLVPNVHQNDSFFFFYHLLAYPTNIPMHKTHLMNNIYRKNHFSAKESGPFFRKIVDIQQVREIPSSHVVHNHIEKSRIYYTIHQKKQSLFVRYRFGLVIKIIIGL